MAGCPDAHHEPLGVGLCAGLLLDRRDQAWTLAWGRALTVLVAVLVAAVIGVAIAVMGTRRPDDRNFFPKHEVSLVLTDKIAQVCPQIAELIKPVSEKLTDDVLLEPDAEVDVTGKEPARVAFARLEEEGFVTG